MKKTAVLGIASGVAAVVVAGGGYALYKKSTADQSEVSRQAMEAALNNMKARAENPDQKPFKDKDLGALKGRLAPSVAAAERAKLVQAGIVYFDLDNGKTWEAAQFNDLSLDLLSVLGEEAKTPEEKRLRILSFQLAKRVLPKSTSAEVPKKIDQLLAVKRTDPYEAALFVDLASLPPVPTQAFVDAHARCLSSADTGVVQSCLQTIEQVQSSEVRKQLATALLTKWKSLKEPLKPYAVKTLISQHAFFEADAKSLLSEASKSQGEIWRDVFLYGVAELKAVDEYRSTLQSIEKSAETTSMRQRAAALLR
jgi:hypothetical protein